MFPCVPSHVAHSTSQAREPGFTVLTLRPATETGWSRHATLSAWGATRGSSDERGDRAPRRQEHTRNQTPAGHTRAAPAGAILIECPNLAGLWIVTGATTSYRLTPNDNLACLYDVRDDGSGEFIGQLIVSPDGGLAGYFDEPCRGVYEAGRQTLELTGADGEPVEWRALRP